MRQRRLVNGTLTVTERVPAGHEGAVLRVLDGEREVVSIEVNISTLQFLAKACADIEKRQRAIRRVDAPWPSPWFSLRLP